MSDLNPFEQIAAQNPQKAEPNPFQAISQKFPTLTPHIPGPTDPGVPQHTAPPEMYEKWINQAANTSGVPANLITSVIRQESGFNQNARNAASGAEGLGQFLPATAHALGINPFDPEQAINGTAKYLQEQYNHFGSWELALAAYNAGPGNVAKFHGIPPFKETQGYVKNILAMANLPETNMQETLDKIRSAEPKPAMPIKHNGESATAAPKGMMQLPRVGATITEPVPATITNVIQGLVKGEQFVLNTLSDPGGTAVQIGMQMIPQRYQSSAYSAQSKIGEAWDQVNYGLINASARAINEGSMAPLTGYFGSVKYLFENHGIDFGKKFDMLANNYGFNSIGESMYWSRQLGVRDRLMTSKPGTIGGAVVQTLLGMHSDLARVKQMHPWGSAAETFVGELLAPLNLVPFFRGPGKVADIGFMARLEQGFRSSGKTAAANMMRRIMDVPGIGNRYWRAVTTAEEPAKGLQANVDMLMDHEKNTVLADEPVTDVEHWGNLTNEEQFTLQWLHDHPGYNKPQVKVGDYLLDTRMDVPRGGGGSYRARIPNISALQDAQDAEFAKHAPVTAELFHKEGPYMTRKGLWAHEENPATDTAYGSDPSARGAIYKRTVPTIEQGLQEGLKLDLTHSRASAWADQYEKRLHYLTFVKNIKEKLANLPIKGGKMAAQEVHFTWPGKVGNNGYGKFTLVNGQVVDLDRAIDFGHGIAGYQKMMDWAENMAPFVKAARPDMGSGVSSYVLGKTTEAWVKDNPGYSFVWRKTGAPDLAGWAVQDDMLHTAIDANPILNRQLIPFGDAFSGYRLPQLGQWEEKIDAARDPKTLKSSGNVSDLAAADSSHIFGQEFGSQDRFLNSLHTVVQAQAQLVITGLGIYHALLGNVGPRMLADVVRLAGANPVKLSKYLGIMSRGYGAGIAQTAHSVGRVTKDILLDKTAGGGGGEYFTPSRLRETSDWWKVPDKWHDAADKVHALDPDRPMGRFVPSKTAHDLLSVPYGSLSGPKRLLRGLMGGMKWNQDLTFKVQSRNLQAAFFHILTEHEGWEPTQAAQRTRFMSGDLMNLPPAGRMAVVGALSLFFGWHMNKYRYGAQMAFKTPVVPLAVNRAVATLNTYQGHPEVDPSTAAVLNKGSQPLEMSLPQAPLLSQKLVYGLTPFQEGGYDSPGFVNAMGALTVGALGAPASTAAKIAFTLAEHKHPSAPVPYDRFGTAWDMQATPREQVTDLIGSTLGQFNPSIGRGFEDMPTSGPAALLGSVGPEIRSGPKAGGPNYGQRTWLAGQLRQYARYMPPEVGAQAIDAARTLETRDVGPMYYAQALGLYKQYAKPPRKSGLGGLSGLSGLSGLK